MTMPGVSKSYTSSPSGYDYTPRQKTLSTTSSGQLSNGSDRLSDIDDGPSYLLEHLATFSVGSQHSIVDSNDGLKRLWQMEKRSGIWTQKMQMRLTKQWVVIIDFENGDIVERFPMNLISSPMAYTGSDPNELYNNILIFIVKEDPKRKNLNPSEMHIFQCVQVPGQEIVKDLNLFMSGKWKSGYKNNHLPPPPTTPAPEPPLGMNSRYGIDDETSSTGSERYEKEVGILNHCFDDIEQFIAWLQSSAAAYRELERRKADRKSKRKDHGDGMLCMRAKPPPERDFVDVLQKFKLSFNLLAKLKAHIHDPNAPELVHFLFTPLALIVDASRESNYGSNLAARVVSPLLTKEAVELLANCLTSKESDLWHSLGEAWVVPREQWKGNVAPYHPTFRDGYSPEYPFNEEKEQIATISREVIIAAQRARQAEIDKAQKEAIEREMRFRASYYVERDTSPVERPHTQSPQSEPDYKDGTSDYSADSIERIHGDPQKHVQQWLEELKMRNAKIVQVIFPRSANNEKELTVSRGEYLEVLDDGRKWWKARNIRGQVGHVPHTIVTLYDVIHNPIYNKQEPIEPPSQPPPIPPPAPASPEYIQKTRQEVLVVRKPVPKPEPKKMAPPVEPKPRPREEHQDFNEELKRTIRDKGRIRPALRKVKLPPIYINEDSTPADINTFLRAKGFDDNIQKTFVDIGGKEAFQLKRDQLEKYCGKEEGARLASQLTLQKSLCGYRTVKGTELVEKLSKRYSEVENATADDDENGESTAASAFEFLDKEDDGDSELFISSKKQQRSSILRVSAPPPPPLPPVVNGVNGHAK